MTSLPFVGKGHLWYTVKPGYHRSCLPLYAIQNVNAVTWSDIVFYDIMTNNSNGIISMNAWQNHELAYFNWNIL